jgi:hypothetical protein
MWAIISALCIIIVVLVYYNYKTREGFVSGTVNWFGETVESTYEDGIPYYINNVANLSYTYYSAKPVRSLPSIGPEVYIIKCSDVVNSSDIDGVLELYPDSQLATLDQLRESVTNGLSSCEYGYINSQVENTLCIATAGKSHEVTRCDGVGLSANNIFDNGFVSTVMGPLTTEHESSCIYAYGIKPPQNQPSRPYISSVLNSTIETRVQPFNNYAPGWWFMRRPPTNYEIFVVYDVTGKAVEIDDDFTLPNAIADAFKCKIPNITAIREMIQASPSVPDKVYPHWDISGCSTNDDPLRVICPISEQTQTAPIGSSSSSYSGGALPTTPKLSITSYPRTPPLTVPGVLLYGPKPSYDARDIVVGGRKFRAEFYNTVRNVWSKYDPVKYKCKSINIPIQSGMLYGTYAKIFVSNLETPGSLKKVTTKITGGANENRAYPGCAATCNACERTEEPYYDARPILDINKHDKWKNQPVELNKDDPRVFYDQIPVSGQPNPEKISAAIRLVNACREAGGHIVLNANEINELKGCPAESWCCSPDKDLSIALPLSERDPMAATVNKTCEPVEEECDPAPSPAPLDADAYRLSKDGQRSRISKDVKDQYCKAKKSSIRTLAQERKSNKLLERQTNTDKR